MSAERSDCPDWRDGAAYRPLLDADRSLIAWEWLRRDPDYRAAAIRCFNAGPIHGAGSLAPRHFGLIAFEPPGRAVPYARPLWTRAVHPFVLPVERGPDTHPADGLEIERFGRLRELVIADGREHLLLSDGLRTIRLDGSAGTFTNGPANLAYSIYGLCSSEAPLLTLRRLLVLAKTSRFSRMLHRPEAHANRWVLILRAADGLAAGARQREIAEVLLSRSAREPQWRIRDPSLRLKVQRLVRLARHFAGDGYRELLG